MGVWTGWYRIYATLMPWVAFSQAIQSEIAAPKKTVGLDCLLCIFRTTGIKATVISKKWTDSGAIYGN